MKSFFYIIALFSIVIFSCKNEVKELSPSEKAKENSEAISKIAPSNAQIGLDMAFTTKAELGNILKKTIKEKGLAEAMQLCNIKAIPLTDSLAMVYHASIKRVSDKARNPNNVANETELNKIATFKKIIANGEEMKPIIETKNDSVYFYYPIVTNGMCLQCHGKKEDVNKDVLASLKKGFPEDNALGYSENQVRGIWSIRFKEE